MEGSLYIHIPFCRRRCIYCNFSSEVYDDALAAAYIDVLSKQIKSLKGFFSTVYIGGGTPTVLDMRLLDKLFGSLRGVSGSADYEFTVEANPESTDREKLERLLGFGVNRLSIGAQSTLDKKLHRLGRIHDYTRCVKAVDLARKTGFGNISIDLMFGVWGETLEEWRRDLEEAVLRFPATHFSCYELTYEKDTPLFSALKNKSLTPLSEDEVAAMYELAIETLSLRGFKQYEISNFAKEGYRCRHNLNYWDNDPYIGLGASAFSYANGVRSKNVSSVSEYIERYNSGKPLIDFSEKLPVIRMAKETAAVKIRTKDGIDFDWFRDKTGYDFLELENKALPRLVEDGLIKYKRQGDSITGICLRRKGFLFCDTVSSALL